MSSTSKTAIVSIRNEFGTREDTNLEKVTTFLHARKNKAVKLDDLAKAVYKSASTANRMKVKMVVVGLNMTIEAYALPYAKVVFSGRGEEATLSLTSKKVSKK